MIIDFHTHVFPNKIANHAMIRLAKSTNTPYFGAATVEGLTAAMSDSGVDKAVVLNIVTKESQHENVLKFAKTIDSEQLISFGSVLPGPESALEYVWKISDEGLKGIKLHPALQRIRPDDKKYFPVYDLARALNLIMTFHVGWDPSYPNELHASPESIVKIVKNFPGLKVVAAHLGGLKMAQNVFDRVAGKADIYMDTAYCADVWLNKQLLKDIIRKHGAERILMGSDYPWHLPSQEIAMIRALDLSKEEKDLILGGNAFRLLGL